MGRILDWSQFKIVKKEFSSIERKVIRTLNGHRHVFWSGSNVPASKYFLPVLFEVTLNEKECECFGLASGSPDA